MYLYTYNETYRLDTYEGGWTKPRTPDQMSRWRSRECERCDLARPGYEPYARSFAVRLFNQPWKHEPSNVELT